MYENLKWKYSQLKEQIKTATGDKKAMLEGQLNGVEKQITNKNGIYQDAEDMFMSMTSEIVNSAKYTKTASSSGSSDVTSNSKTYGGVNSVLPSSTDANSSSYGFSISNLIGGGWASAGNIGDNYYPAGLGLRVPTINWDVFATKQKRQGKK